MHASQVLDVQGELVERFQTEAYNSYMLGRIKSEERWTPGKYRRGDASDDTPGQAMADILKHAYAYHVKDYMCDIIMEAAKSPQLKEDAVLHRYDVPTATGFVIFDKPLIAYDIWGDETKINALLWHPWVHEDGSTGIAFEEFVFEDYQTWPMTEAEAGRRDLGSYIWDGYMPVRFGAPIGPMYGELDDEEKAEYIRVMGSVFPRANRTVEDIKPFTNEPRMFAQFMFLLNQQIVELADAEVDRHARKRAKRRGIPDRVTIIQLRRKASGYKPNGETNVEWSHQWVVRAHWRHQACGPGRKDRKWVLILPYFKGPEDKPLIITEKVYDLMR